MIYGNIFPLPADVWGTVSDWAAVIVYGITGYLIYRTLQSQLKVQELQQIHAKIERYNHIQNILPAFNLEVSDVIANVNIDELHVKNVTCIFKLNNNVAKNVSYKVEVQVVVNNFSISGDNDFQFINSGEGFNISFNFDTKSIKYFPGSISYWIDINFLISYEDIEKNHYNQKCLLTITQNKSYVKSGYPISD